MGSSQRGNGFAYDSLNGYSAIIGLKTGKVLDYTTRNRKCRACENAISTGIKKEHDCRLNFHGSAKAMETDAAVQLVTNSQILKNNNLEIRVFIGDNDSCCISAVQEAGNHVILKQADINHLVKGIGKILYELRKSTSSDPDGELTHDTIKRFQRCFSFAVKQNKGQVEQIRAAIRNLAHVRLASEL